MAFLQAEHLQDARFVTRMIATAGASRSLARSAARAIAREPRDGDGDRWTRSRRRYRSTARTAPGPLSERPGPCDLPGGAECGGGARRAGWPADRAMARALFLQRAGQGARSNASGRTTLPEARWQSAGDRAGRGAVRSGGTSLPKESGIERELLAAGGGRVAMGQLPADGQVLFRRLSVLPAGFPIHGASHGRVPAIDCAPNGRQIAVLVASRLMQRLDADGLSSTYGRS